MTMIDAITAAVVILAVVVVFAVFIDVLHNGT